MTFKDVFNWCAQDIDNVSPITIPRLLMYPANYLATHSTAYPTGAGKELTDYFCRGARLVERTITLGNLTTAVVVGTTLTGGLGIAAGLGVYALGAVFGFAAGHKANGYFRPVTPEQQAAYDAAEKNAASNKTSENDWMSPEGKAQFEAQQKNKKPFDGLKRKLTRIKHFKHYL